MRFMMMMMSTEPSESDLPPDPKLGAAIGKFTVEMMKAGVVLMTGGLGPSSMATRIHLEGGVTSAVDGPFPESKELASGFAIIQVKSKEEALEYGRRFMAVHKEALGPSYQGVLEIRPLVGPEDLHR
ncbi:PhnB protein [Labilithrix luteola]|uniref:PhnB protein n=1 Tax=Labilithrix luteola TaxID=1391654 RepID=A0A0K1PSX2_9BACT|nr:YciI family protein [Labilithrix luteola]AKU96638.1 PhnB protein [Labilithrix luteola]